MKKGNLDIAAAMKVGPIPYSEFSHFSRALRLPIISESSYYEYQTDYVAPAIKELYERQKEITFDELEDELHEFDEEYEEDELL
jgi:hypothetical protein